MPGNHVELARPSDFTTRRGERRPSLDATTTGLLVFVVSWCGHCQALAPELDVAAARMPRDRRIVVVDAEEPRNRAVVAAFPEGIAAFPTIKVVKAGHVLVSEYDGERQAAAIVEFLLSPLLR